MIYKVCNKCGKSKPLSLFYRDKHGKYGRRSDCADCSRAYQKKYRSISKSNKTLYDQHRWAANKERLSGQNKLWAKNNPQRRYLINKNWRSRKTKQLGFVPTNIKEILYKEQIGICYYCDVSLSESYLEHKTPLSRGGFHDIGNLCLSCPSCNLRKGTKTEEEFRVMET